MSTELTIEENTYTILPPRPPPSGLRLINPDDLVDYEPEQPTTQTTEEQAPTQQPPTQQTPTQQTQQPFIKGKFMYIESLHTREMLVNAWNAITQLELWNYMRRETYSYMLSNDKEIWIITRKMEELGYNGHSGCSFGWTMRQMQYIAKHGEEKYMDEVLNNNTNT
jgi:hypothetical protein